MSVEDLKRLYFRRWKGGDRVSDDSKKRLSFENFTGRTENSVLQDFWALMCADQLLWIVEIEADPLIVEDRKISQTSTSIR